jgi:hypothetical protein
MSEDEPKYTLQKVEGNWIYVSLTADPVSLHDVSSEPMRDSSAGSEMEKTVEQERVDSASREAYLLALDAFHDTALQQALLRRAENERHFNSDEFK